MPQNFIDCDREQPFLMPPSLRDWLPADHLAWFVIETVARLDLSVFYAAYRADGHGRATYEPSMVVSLPAEVQTEAGRQGGGNGHGRDWRRMKGNRRYSQGYNAQAVVNEQQIVIAAEITTAAGDFSHLRPMITAALNELEAAGIDHKPDVTVADAQYWNEQHMDDVTREHGIQVLIPPDSGKRKGERPGWTGGRYSFMRRVLATDLGRPKTPEVNPARLRSHQTQPQDRSLPPTRQVGSAYRVAINHDESQPHQAPPPPNSHDEVLKRPPPRPHRPTRIARHQRHRQRRPAQRPAKTFARQPPRKARLCGRAPP